MRVKDAARYFDRVACADAYAAYNTFKGQLDLYDDSKRDGATVARRVLSVADGVTLPPRGVFTAHGETFLIGGLHTDSFQAEVVRRKYVCHRAEELATVQTLEQAVLEQTGSTAYAARLWVKDMKEVEVSSKLNAFFNIYFAPSEAPVIGSIVTLSGRKHLVRSSFVSAGGFRLCEADELPETCVATATSYVDRSGQAYNVATDQHGALAPVTAPVLWHRFQSGFEYLYPSAEKFEEGDITVNVSKESVAAAGVGDTFTLLGAGWRALSVRDNGANVWMIHARRV